MSTLTSMNQPAYLVSPNGTKFTNTTNIPKELAIFAIFHSASYDGKPTTATNMSVSDFLTPMRKLLYKIKNPPIEEISDVAYIMKSAKGTAMHSGLEQALAWYGGYKQEIRSETERMGVTISGKFDLIDESTMTIKDLKNVSSFAYKMLMDDMVKLQTMDNSLSVHERMKYIPTYTKYQLQLSMYRWLNPDLDLKPWGDIIFSLNNGGGFDNYPIDNFHRFPLLLNEEIEQFVIDHLTQVQAHLANDTMPFCSDEERGKRNGEWKLQRMSPTNHSMSTVRGSKFDNESDFRDFVRKSGRAGDQEVITEPTCVLCNYCAFSSTCDQPL